MSYQFDSRLAFASTIPSSYYTDPAALAAETRKVFGTTWQLVGRAEQVREPGQYFTATIGGEPLLVVRGNDRVLRAMSNVCRHRAGPVAYGEGKRPVLQCQYHGWTYSLDGKLHATPEFEGVECFERTSVALPQFRIEEWHELLFANIDPAAPPLSEYLGDLSSEMPRHDHSGFRLAARKDWELDCNWKVYVDNYLEGYHIPIVHPGLFQELDYGAYRVETRAWHSRQHAPVKGADTLYHRDLPEGGAPEALYYWVFPNMMLNLYPDNLQTNLILPLGPDRTLTRFEWYVLEPHSPGVAEEFARSFAFSDEVQREDIGICEAVQQGLRSRTYRQGRYSVLRENGLHHFHGLMARALA